MPMPEAVSSREEQNGKAAIIEKVVVRLSLIYPPCSDFSVLLCSCVLFMSDILPVTKMSR